MCCQQMQLVRFEPKSLTEDTLYCWCWYPEVSAGSLGCLSWTSNETLLWFDPHVLHLLTATQSTYLHRFQVVIPACDCLINRWILPKRCSEPSLNCSHRFRLIKPRTTLRYLLLRRHLGLRTLTAPQWPGSELPHVTENLKSVISLL
jgi:hypothetical protein